jgi:hypothetical protein
MSTSKLPVAIAVVAALFLIGFGLYEYSLARTTEVQVAFALRELNAQAKHLEDLNSQAAASEQARATLRKSAATPRADPPPAKRPAAVLGVRSSTEPVRDAKADGQAFLAAFPEQRTAIMEIGKAQIARGYGAFFRAAGLSPAQIDQFETLVSQTWLDNILVSPNGVHPAPVQPPADQMQALLGDQAYQQYQDYQRTQEAHGLTLQLATAVTNANAPAMSADQADQLAQIIMTGSPGAQSGRGLNPATVDWDAVMTQAQGVLAPQQLQVAQGLLLNMQYQTALAQARRAQSAPDPARK